LWWQQAPIAANYTFNTRFDDGGELWVSPNADPRAAERVAVVDSVEEESTAAGADADSSTGFCSAWECGDRACFRSYYGFLTNDNAIKSCESVGAKLGTPRSSAEVDLITASQPVDTWPEDTWYWIGVNDMGEEGTWRYSDGTLAGVAVTRGSAASGGFSYEGFGSSQPDDYSNTENCVQIRVRVSHVLSSPLFSLNTSTKPNKC